MSSNVTNKLLMQAIVKVENLNLEQINKLRRINKNKSEMSDSELDEDALLGPTNSDIMKCVKDSMKLMANINNGIVSTNNKIDAFMKNTDIKLNALEETMVSSTNQIASIDDRLRGVEKSTNDSLDSLEKRLKSVERSSAEANYINELNKQQKLANNVIISGIPKQDNENLVKLTIKLCNLLGVNVLPNQIVSTFRLRFNKNQFSVRFTDVQLKISLLKNNSR